MKVLTPVDIVVEELTPPEGGFFATPEMCPPYFSTPEVAKFFFARSRVWLWKRLDRDQIELDGQRVTVARNPVNDNLQWRLYDVERLAYGLAQVGKFNIHQLYRTIALVKLVAENWEYRVASPIATRVEAQNNGPTSNRRLFVATETVVQVTDDFDGTPGATTRRYSIGEMHYKADLTDENYRKLVLEPLQQVVAISTIDQVRRKANTEAEREERKLIRIWAKQNGHEIGERGRIPFELVDRYRAEMAAGSEALDGHVAAAAQPVLA